MSSASPVDEMCRLVDQIYDGQIDVAGWARIESLIRQDRRHLQTYVERFDFHCELTEQADHRPAEITAMAMLQRSSRIAARREGRRFLRVGVLLACCTILFAVGLGLLYYSTVLNRPGAGFVTGLSMNTDLASASLELGQVIRQRDTISIRTGIVSLQFHDVQVDLIGPSRLRVDSPSRLFLMEGRAVSRVGPEGIGFTVNTPEAEVVDLGTEFVVEHDRKTGTYVGVRRGATEVRQFDWRNDPIKVMEVTASRGAQFHKMDGVSSEVAFSDEVFQAVDQSRKGILKLSGSIRTLTEPPASVESDQFTTPNHMVIFPEQTQTLTEDLLVNSLQGPVTIRAGSTVESYLVHYDPTLLIRFAPRGAVSFQGEIAGVIGTSSELNRTDSLFGAPDVSYEQRPFRELELDEDEVLISDDRRTVSFFFGLTPPEYLDEARVLVISSHP